LTLQLGKKYVRVGVRRDQEQAEVAIERKPLNVIGYPAKLLSVCFIFGWWLCIEMAKGFSE